MSKFNDYLKSIILISIIIIIIPLIMPNIQYQWSKNLESHNKIGYICINGPINNSSLYRKHLTHYFKDSSIKAILLKIESNGGATGSCQALAFDIESLKKEYPKPIITYTENMCTSGAYEIAAATDHIVATGSAVIGNIGARISSIYNLEKILEQYNLSHDLKEALSDTCKKTTTYYDVLSNEQQIMLQSLVNNSYQQLSKEIASKRHLQLSKIDQWGQDKIFTGQQAYDLKLVDALGSKTTAINLIKKNIIPSDRKIEWVIPEEKSLWKKIFDNTDEYEDLEN